MLYVVSYDISDDRRRTRIAKTLLDFGSRVQYSVFECILDDDLLRQMRERIEKIASIEEDRVRIYTMCAKCERAIALIGRGEITKDKDVYII